MTDSIAQPSAPSFSRVPVPPMEYNLWGTTDEAKPLSPSVQKLLANMLGASAESVDRVAADDVKLSEPRVTEADLSALAEIVGSGYVTTDRAQRMPRARGKSYTDLLDWRRRGEISAPDAVVAPGSETEVLRLLQLCGRLDLAVVPFGGGTSVVGGVNPLAGQHRAVISLDLARFDALEDVDAESGLATLGAGLTGPHAELKLAEHGLQLGHFPQSFPYATIGGFAATRSSGQSSAGYGRFDEMVRSLTVVTPKGILHPGQAAPSSAAGPDLKQLFLGSEGTLGIITSVRLRVRPIPKPEAKRYEAFQFPSFAEGVAAVRAVEQQQTGPTVIRLSDEIESSVNLTSTDSIGDGGDRATGCLCLTMYEGTPEHTESRHKETRSVLLAHGGTSLGEGPVRAWEQGRFGAPVLRDGLLDNGAICETLETATDWSNAARLKQAVAEVLSNSLQASGTMALIMCHISHVYATGCSLYFTVIAAQQDSPDPVTQWRKAKAAACEAIQAAGGTITHHHAVGTDHQPYFSTEVQDLGVDILRAVKAALDPDGILNPGKLMG